MPYTITPTPDFIHVAWHGTICVDDVARVAPDLAQMGQRQKSASNVLHTFDQVTEVDMEPIMAYQHAIRRNEMRVPARVKAASVATTPTVFAYARLFEELNRNPMIEMRVFDAREPAVKWLAEPIVAGD